MAPSGHQTSWGPGGNGLVEFAFAFPQVALMGGSESSRTSFATDDEGPGRSSGLPVPITDQWRTTMPTIQFQLGITLNDDAAKSLADLLGPAFRQAMGQ